MINPPSDQALSRPCGVEGDHAGKLPDFLIVGAAKCGTSAMRRLLGHHPDLFMVHPELNFFTHGWTNGLVWYRSHFRTSKLAGEKTPGYLSSPQSMVRIRRTLPTVKLIVLLRDPCLRFVSHYRHDNGRTTEARRWKSVSDFLDSDQADDFLWRGMYAAQLSALFQLFDREQVCIVYNEQMRQDTARELARVQSFLGVSQQTVSANPRPESVIPSPRVKRTLAEFYSEPNRQLHQLLGDEAIRQWI